LFVFSQLHTFAYGILIPRKRAAKTICESGRVSLETPVMGRA
jgi:hypothetical protein